MFEHIQNFWGDLITAAGAQSNDGKAAYVQLNLAGDQGSTVGNESVEAVREDRRRHPPPAGLHAYVTGPAPLTTDTAAAGDKSMVKMMVITMAVITVMLLIVYRSISTVLLILAVVGIEMGTARGVGRPARPRPPDRLLHILGQPAHRAGHRRRHRLRDLSDRPISRSTPGGRRPRDRVLHHIPRRRPRHPRLRTDHRRSGAVPAFNATDLLQIVGDSLGGRPGHRRRRRADAWRRPCWPWPAGSDYSTRNG